MTPANPLATSLAHRYRKTPGQIVLSWEVQQGIVAIPKSVMLSGRRESRHVRLGTVPSDMRQIAGLDHGEEVTRDSVGYEEF